MERCAIDFTRGIPSPETFPVEDLVECGAVALRRDPAILLQYRRGGYPPLHNWLAEEYQVQPEQVLTTNSSLEALSYMTQVLLSSRGRVFLGSPTYDRSITLLRRAGAELVGMPVREDGLDLQILEAELQRGRPALVYVIPDFQNPMGVTMSLAKRRALVALAEEYSFWIVEDSPYRRLRYWGEDIPSLFSLGPSRVLHMSSFSKVLSPGLRLGYIVGSEEMMAELADWAVDSHIGPVLPTQGMVYEYCRRGLLDENIERLKAIYRPRLEATVAALDQYIPQSKWTRPQGGYFVSGFLPPESNTTDLRARASLTKLELSDGRAFFLDPNEGDRFVRVPFVRLSSRMIEDGISRLARLL